MIVYAISTKYRARISIHGPRGDEVMQRTYELTGFDSVADATNYLHREAPVGGKVFVREMEAVIAVDRTEQKLA